MKKKYSDPLMFSAVLLGEIPIGKKSGEIAPDDEVIVDDEADLGDLSVNYTPGIEASEPVTIVNPVEEAVSSEETAVDSTAPAAESSSPLEVAPIIDSLVPDETGASAEAGE